MKIVPATLGDVTSAARCLSEAFANEPATTFLFAEADCPKLQILQEMSELVARANLAMGMPLLVAKSDGIVLGTLAGTSAKSNDWPKELEEQWQQFELRHKEVGPRFRRFEEITTSHKPKVPHFKINMVGVAAGSQGRGIGRMLVDQCCKMSDEDSTSRGVILETATPSNIEYYSQFGFELLGGGALDQATTLWCMYRPKS